MPIVCNYGGAKHWNTGLTAADPQKDLWVQIVSGGSKNVEKGGGRQFIISVLICRKCTQRNICLLHGKNCFLEKNMSQWGGGRPHRPPFKCATANTHCIFRFVHILYTKIPYAITGIAI